MSPLEGTSILTAKWRRPDQPPLECCIESNVSLALGVFDGVHLGHQELLHRAVRDATEIDSGAAAVLTFDPNPARLTRSANHLGDLTTIDQRLGLFGQHGIAMAVVVGFSHEFAELSGHRFLETMLKVFPRLQLVVVGFNFHLGRGRDVDTEELARWMEQHGVRVDIVPALQDNHGSISSSRIRRAVADGDIQHAVSLLGRPYSLAFDGILPSHRRECVYVLPPRGTYRCQLSGPTGDESALLEIAEDGRLSWVPSPPQVWYVTFS